MPRVLVIGSGGREHALCWKLAQEAQVHCMPGNPGISQIAECHAGNATDVLGTLRTVQRLNPDLVVVGPEDPLVLGLADALRRKGFAVYGPDQDGAQLEASKAFSKAMMEQAGVTTAAFETFTEPEPALEYVRERYGAGFQVAVKASGNALGKGAVVCDSLEAAEEAVRSMLERKELGEAGSTVVIEDRLTGREFSLLTLCSEGEILSLPVAQDYKRIFDGGEGPNTGGMGSVSPVGWVSEDLVREVEERAVRPILKALDRRNIPFRGTLFSGLMVQEGVPYCLEYNVRFGDPETQSVMARLGGGFYAALLACANAEPIPEIEVLDNAAVTVVVASGGYPGTPSKGHPIQIGDLGGASLFHAGTAMLEGQLVNSGGRVFGVTGVGPSVSEARAQAYGGVRAISFEGMQFRTDIAQD